MNRAIVTPRLESAPLTEALLHADKTAIMTDSNVRRLLPGILGSRFTSLPVITIPAGESNKTLSTAADVWNAMSDLKLTRDSMIINVGGGVVTDLGGFCASTYMRGIPFINISTTLLGAVDASTGGKTGVDVEGMKNRVGTFAPAIRTFIPVNALLTLPEQEVMSGYAEMVKTAYISSESLLDRLLAFNPLPISPDTLTPLIRECLAVKEDIVSADPYEKGLRRCLNFGHTAGHAFETMALLREHPMPHGNAVAHGMLVALVLSHMLCRLPSDRIYTYADWLKTSYPPMRLHCGDYDEVLHLMRGDKKNTAAGIRFSLLAAVGDCRTDIIVEKNDIKTALDIYCDLTGQ